LARWILDEEQYDRTQMHLHRTVIAAHPRLLMEVHVRFEQITSELVEHIVRREGPDFGVERARLLVRLLVALFDTCLGSLTHDPASPADPDRPLADLFDSAMDTARELLA